MDLYPGVIAIRNVLYEDVYKVTGLKMRMTSGLRTIEEQEKIYAIGRTLPGNIVTRARPGYSFHNYGLAFDSCWTGSDPFLEKMPKKDRDYLWGKFGELVRSHGGLFWGGDFKTIKDLPHAEKRYGLTIQECLDLHAKLGLNGFYEYLDELVKKI